MPTTSKPPPRQKSPTSIEVWRHEVSESASTIPPDSSPSSPSPSPELKRQPSFWKKLLPTRSRSNTTTEPHVQVNGFAVPEPTYHHQSTKQKRKPSDTPEPGVRTSMYNKAFSNRSRLKNMNDGNLGDVAGEMDDGLLGVDDDEEDVRGGSSMEIASGDSDEAGGLKDKMERLERARRLLEGKGRGKGNGG